MKHLVVADPRPAFLQDLSTRVMLEERSLLIDTVTVPEKLFEHIRQGSLVILCDLAIDETTPNLTNRLPENVQIYGYCTTADGRFKFSDIGIPCIGVVTKSATLLDMLEENPIPVMEGVKMPPKRQPAQISEPQTAKAEQPYNGQSQPAVQAQEHFSLPRTEGGPARGRGEELAAPSYGANGGHRQMEPRNTAPSRMEPVYDPGYDMTPQTPPQRNISESNYRPATTTPQAEPPDSDSFKTGAEKLSSSRASRMNKEADREIEEEAMSTALRKSRKTKVITVYAAKGGVGKTTIASNTAVCMALTTNGRSKFRVCIADYNIDFGDVCTTLNLDPRGANMVHWAQDIRERMEKGERPEDINYDKQDLEETWLQKMKDVGLYALIAPVVHEDSMDIGEHELTVMIRNLIDNGDFDFIICDTGNNTRDSSVIALETADIVFMVATQDVTTANANDAFISTMKKIGFDLNKVKLIINNIMSSQSTGISVKDIEKSFPYSCVARIKRDEEIIKSNNTGTPIVYNSSHDFTKQIRGTIKYITKDIIPSSPKEQQKKKSSASGISLFGKKRK